MPSQQRIRIAAAACHGRFFKVFLVRALDGVRVGSLTAEVRRSEGVESVASGDPFGSVVPVVDKISTRGGGW
jgi:hypothetical protein